MAGSKRRFFSGNTLERALVSAATEFGLAPEEVEYKQIEKRHGFLNVRKRIVIEVDPDNPRRSGGVGAEVMPLGQERVQALPVPDTYLSKSKASPETRQETFVEPARGESSQGEPPQVESAPVEGGEGSKERAPGEEREAFGRRESPSREAESRSRESRPRDTAGAREVARQPSPPREGRELATGSEAEAAREALGRTLALLDLEVSGQIYRTEERVEIELEGRDSRFFHQQHGRALFAVEHLMPKLIRGLTGEKVFCSVDCGSYREHREEELRELAERTADSVARSGRPRTLEWLNPAERRIVHLELASDPDVLTESEGEGYLKQMTIRPA